MCLIAAYRAAPTELVLADSLAATDVELVFDPVPSVFDDRSLHFWAAGSDLDGFESAMRDDGSVREIERLYDADWGRLYAGTASDGATGPDPAGTDDGVRISTRFADGWWHAEARFVTPAAFATFCDALSDRNVTVELEAVYHSRDGTEPELTDRQRETLEQAYRRGFFNVPRDVTMGDLAETFDVSEQAISQRLRRAYARLVEAAVVEQIDRL